jgi:acetyl esterase
MQRAHIDRRGFVDHITLHLNDPLRDEGKAYARKLKEAGVAVTATRGTIHDFVLLNALRDLPGTQAALKQASEAIRDALRP